MVFALICCLLSGTTGPFAIGASGRTTPGFIAAADLSITDPLWTMNSGGSNDLYTGKGRNIQDFSIQAEYNFPYRSDGRREP
jgi:hypothetical protein